MIFFGLSNITFKVYLLVASGESLAGTSGAVHMASIKFDYRAQKYAQPVSSTSLNSYN
jgi:hypothetical protein